LSRPPLLAVDAGNTDTVIAVFDGADVTAQRREPTAGRPEAERLVRAVVAASGLRPGATVVSTPGERLDAAYRGLIPELLGHSPLLVDGGSTGPDRLANCAAAHALLGGACIVCDLGTATTVDAVDAAGEFLGGAIAPGLAVALRGLAEHAVRLVPIELQPPRQAIGRDTVEAMRSGSVLGHAGLLDGLVERFREELGEPVPAVATGGLAALVVPYCRQVERIQPGLTLDGLRLLWERSQAAPA
jgi:type III pantothenate kinase